MHGQRLPGACRLRPGYVLVIAEKPKAGEKIAEALASGRPLKCRWKGIPYWVLRHNGSTLVVAPSAGHLYGPHSSSRGYPVLDYEWRPLWEFERGSRHLKKFHDALAALSKLARLYINACDYDIEGSVIGYMIIAMLGDPRRARRMKFSSLSPQEIREAFKRLEPLDKEMIEAGMARHELDWLWGINLSRALMETVRRVTRRRVILSAGRVQTPTLVEAVRRWRERNLHVPKPRFPLKLTLRTGGKTFTARPRGWEAQSRLEASKLAAFLRREGFLKVRDVARSERVLRPPPAFNLGDLQSEAARLFKYSPMKTQSIAENLYLEALISYPRTNSQKLPPTIDYHSIILRLSRVKASGIGALAARLLAETRGILRPIQGRKEDPAHPAIYPTGELPRRALSDEEWRVYELIIRRFLAAFSRPARISSTIVVLVDSLGREYEARGVEVIEEGWLAYYHYLKPREALLPPLKPGMKVEVTRVSYSTEWTRASTQLSKASLVKWMESVGIGTEATRARIVEILFKRGYLESRGGTAVVTDLGEAVASTMESLVPVIASPELTRRFEEMLEDIRRGRRGKAEVIEEAKKAIVSILKSIDSSSETIGLKLAYSMRLQDPPRKCPICGRESDPRAPRGLCRFHMQALERLATTLPVIAEKLNMSLQEALNIISRRSEAGIWIREVAEAATRDDRLRDYLMSRARPPR
jgi:DNA topoisomerase-1